MLEFKEVPDADLVYRRLSTDGRIELGVGFVLYGYRIRAGWVAQKDYALYYELDWCAGADLRQVEQLYSICLSALAGGNAENPFTGLPGCSRVKPFFKDPEFLERVAPHVAAAHFRLVALPQLSEKRQKFFALNFG